MNTQALAAAILAAGLIGAPAGALAATTAGSQAVVQTVSSPTCAQKLALQLSAEFPSVAIDADARPGDALPEHAEGRAIDVLIDDWVSPDRVAVGDAINARVLQLGAEGAYPVVYTTWRQTYSTPAGERVGMEDRGNPTQNHLDHLHASLAAMTC